MARWQSDFFVNEEKGPGTFMRAKHAVELVGSKVAADLKKKFVWPVMRLQDGSVADY